MRPSIFVVELKRTHRLRNIIPAVGGVTSSSSSSKRAFSVSGVNQQSNSGDLRNYKAVNEPVLDYVKNSSERAQIQRKLDEFMQNASKIRNDQREALFDVPIVIGDKEVSSLFSYFFLRTIGLSSIYLINLIN